VGAAAGSKISETATRVIGERGVEAVTNVATKAEEAATMDVGEAASRVMGRETGEAATAATTRILPNAADDAASATTRMGDDLTATQILPNAGREAAEAAAGRTTQMIPQAATEAEQATTRMINPQAPAREAMEGATTRMVNPRAAAEEAFRGAETQVVPQSTRIPPPRPASAPQVPSQAARGAEDALRAQNITREAALNERLAREAAEAQRTLEQRGVDSLSAAEASKLHTQIQTGAMNRQTQGLLQEARNAGIPESKIAELTDVAHSAALPKRGASIANQNLVEEIARARGQTIIESEVAEPLLTTVVNVQTGAAGRQEVEVLRRGIESAKQRGADFFDDLSRQGTSSSDGFHPIADSQDIEALRRFARQNRLIE
jgi:hypothetical protein